MGGAADKAGRSVMVAVAGGLALVCAAALALHLAQVTEIDLGALAVAAIIPALLGLIAIQRDVRRSRAQHDKVSEELDTLAQTLFRIESSLAALDGSGSKASSTLNDVAGDVHSLSQVVRSLAEAMAAQDREIGALKRGESPRGFAAAARSDAASSQPLPPPSLVPSFLPAREVAEAALSESLPAAPSRPGRSLDGNAGILAAAALGEVDLHVDPVVNLPQRRERIYQIVPLLVGSGKEALLPAQYMSVLEGSGRLPDFEAGLVARTLVFAHRLATAGIEARVSLPLSRASLAERSFLRRLETLVEDHAEASRRLILEIEQQAWTELGADSDGFARIRRSGVGFALSKVTDENLNPPALARLGVRHVKLDVSRLMAAIGSDGPGADILTLVEVLARSAIEVIAEGVDDEVVVPELLDIGVPLAQGLAFALPCPVETVLEQPRRGAPAAKLAAPSSAEPPKPDGSGPPQGSLRDFLRRAV
jgi:cyclic-di-GMP phosphodiesterase TipF (flagellum assembly factor)